MKKAPAKMKKASMAKKKGEKIGNSMFNFIKNKNI